MEVITFLGGAASRQVEAPDVGVLEELGVCHFVSVAGERRVGGVFADHRHALRCSAGDGNDPQGIVAAAVGREENRPAVGRPGE